MQLLNQALHYVPNDMDYGGAAAQALNLEPLEAAVDEARRMICVLSGEMRRRTEGELVVWETAEICAPKTSRVVSAGI